ncbi:OsmC family protein [Novosphingobium sp. Gsoil 351]|uniref:OsmC family protein n=1 Tax=Novosphingobium sp. Gsoil 351 TaxID=2675225 RepID=UPI0012B4D47E|nr:OsmC family protein [Novosphingobium sp. Gsoil 351]QGN55717.1 OsmC family peroxiredoxin [Novosphingobium sp. Gsoil 351]
MLDTVKTNCVNDIDLTALEAVVSAIDADPANAQVGFHVTSRWMGQTRSETTVEAITLGGDRIERNFGIVVDEPDELLGTNTAPNPQELLMTAVNACMVVGYVAGAAIRGIELDKLEIETKGELDLRGFLGLRDDVPAGYKAIDYEVRISGKGTAAQFAEIHESVMATSPNYFNMSRPIKMNGKLNVM